MLFSDVAGPDSPPISDDEESKGVSTLLKLLNDAIEECEINEDSDLCDYFDDNGQGEGEGEDDDDDDEEDDDDDEDDEDDDEDEDVVEIVVKQEPPQPAPQVSPPKANNAAPARPYFNLVSDHCYHKDKNASMRIISLGIETPSDSGESTFFSLLYPENKILGGPTTAPNRFIRITALSEEFPKCFFFIIEEGNDSCKFSCTH